MKKRLLNKLNIGYMMYYDEFIKKRVSILFQKILRQAGFAKGMATVPLCFIKKKKHINYRKKYLLTTNH